MTTGERIKKARIEKGLTQEELGKMIGVQRAAINKYEKGTVVNLRRSTIANLAHALDVDPTWLLGMDDNRLPTNVIVPTFAQVPVIGTIACGKPILASENIEGYARVTEIACDFALRCAGDSMTPTLQDGDLVLIRQQPDVDDGQIAAVRIEDEAALKHLYHTPNGIMLVSENAKYPPITYTLSEYTDIAVIGLAVGYQRII